MQILADYEICIHLIFKEWLAGNSTTEAIHMNFPQKILLPKKANIENIKCSIQPEIFGKYWVFIKFT